MTAHVCARVDFTGTKGQPGEDAPMACRCGWQGQVGDFSAHRRIEGARNTGSAACGPARKRGTPFLPGSNRGPRKNTGATL